MISKEILDGYVIYRDGKLFSAKRNKFLKPHKIPNGYLQYRLYDENRKQRVFLAHRLVAIAFIDNPHNKPTVNHINNIRTDNRVENLEWATQSEQMIQAYRNGKKSNYQTKHGKDHPKSKPVTNGVKVYETGLSAERDGFWSSAISLACRGKLKTHGGYKWSFVESK